MDAIHRPPFPSSPAAATISNVLEDDDLLGEALLRLVFPTSLVRAALVCRRWLRVASDPAFLRRFRDLHPPRLLGLYVQTGGRRSPMFVPPPRPPAELAAAIRRAGSILDASLGVTAIWDCHNGRLLVSLNDNPERDAVLSPLHLAGDDAVALPPQPLGRRSLSCLNEMRLAADGVVYGVFRTLQLLSPGRGVIHRFQELRDGIWHRPTFLRLSSRLLPAFLITCRPLDGKLYLMVRASDIATLPSTLSALPYLSIISLPDGVECTPRGSVEPWVDDSGLYLIHVKELQLRVWLRVMDSGKWIVYVCVRFVLNQA